MINLNGTHSIEKFIEKALYNKNFGYYSQNNPLGSKGDFITAPLISPLFSEMISVWVISFWIKLGKPKKFSFVELGPGDGSFCKTFCRTLNSFPESKRSIKIYLLERSKKLIKIQKNTIKEKNVFWIDNLSQIKNGPVLFFGNEFFDSIPIKQFKAKGSNIYEKFIQFEKGRFKKFIFKKASNKIIKKLHNLNLLRKRGVIEYPQKGLKILESIIKKIHKFKG
ncbi:SAM-dependent methyltransferase, partial [Pelagibacteraceae bacterium]|nr:SAM-dependent methyltransferase [Pelagibacteraceae bacterium]